MYLLTAVINCVLACLFAIFSHSWGGEHIFCVTRVQTKVATVIPFDLPRTSGTISFSFPFFTNPILFHVNSHVAYAINNNPEQGILLVSEIPKRFVQPNVDIEW